MALTYSEPDYLYPAPTTIALSQGDDTRPTHLAPQALLALNHLIDELLHLVVHSSLHSTPSPLTPTSSPSGGLSTQPPTPLGATEVLTSDRFKSALARILGPTSLAKECILEAELAVRELVRRGSPSLRADGALERAPGVWGSPVLPSNGAPLVDDEELVRQASETFRALRAWAMQISGLGAALPAGSAAAPAPLPEHLVALMPPRPAPDPSPHVTFVLALYVERVLTTLGAHLLRLVSGVVARSVPPADAASVADVETALMEDTLVWSWLQGMRVRAFIADEAAQERARRTKGSPTLSQGSALPRRSVSSAGTAAAATKSALAGATEPARKASLTGAAAGTLMGSRRPSSDSTTATSAAGAPTYARKDSSTGLGISTSSGGLSVPQQPPVGDAFDELLVSGRTLKLSSTPDRLRTYENRPGGAPAPSSSSATPSPRRLRARDPQPRHLSAEEDEDAVTANEEQQRPERQRESFLDLLNSPPPADPAANRLSLHPRRPIPTDDPSHPMSVAMRVQESHDSMHSIDSPTSAVVEQGDSPRTRSYKAKDEKRDLASERQINRDLANFFSNPPPGPGPAAAPARLDRPSTFVDDAPSARQPASSPTKGKSGFRGLMSMVTGGGSSKSKDKDVEPRPSLSSPPSSPPPPSYRSRSSMSASSPSGAAAPATSVSQAAMRAAGFGENVALAAKAAAYAAPPGLAGPSSPRSGRRESYDRPQGRRSKSGASASAATGYGAVREEDRAQQATRPAALAQRKASLPSTNGAPSRANGTASSASSSFDERRPNGADDTAAPASLADLAPPIPLVAPTPPPDGTARTLGPPISIKPPRRSSSLKRSAREREPSGPADPRTRESSVGSTTRSPPTMPLAPHQLVEVESAAPPVVVAPSASASTRSSEDVQRDVPADAAPVEQQGAASLDAAAGLAAAEAPLEVQQPQEEADARAVPGSANGLVMAAPLSPVDEVPTPSSSSFAPIALAAAAQQQPQAPQQPQPWTTTPPSTPPQLALSPPSLPGHLTTSTLSGTKSIVGLLKELRGAMLFAETRDECVELVEGMLRDQARRVEALAQREREEERESAARLEAARREEPGTQARAQKQQDEGEAPHTQRAGAAGKAALSTEEEDAEGTSSRMEMREAVVVAAEGAA